jgi:hypothetical protein
VIVVGILLPGDASSDAAIEIARRAAATGARTEIVGVAPAGPVGDRQLVELAAAGVGHATVTRSGAAGIEPADLELALRYLPDIRAVVLVEPAAALLAIASAASTWSGATLIVVSAAATDAGDTDPAAAGAAPSMSSARDPSASATDSSASDAFETDAAVSAPFAIDSLATDPVAAEPIVLQPPARDPDGAFAGLVAALAVRLDGGEAPTVAWQATLAALAVDPA